MSDLWQTAPPDQNPRRGKKLQLEGRISAKPSASPWCIRGKRDSTTAGASGASVWDEGGANRIALHVAGGALIGGLGGGSAFSTIGGAAGAGVSSAMAKQLDDIYKGVGSATGSELLGNLAANVVAGVGGALVGGGAGAATASNVELYNQAMHRKKNDLVAQVCPATGQCNESTLNAAIQAQGDLNQAVSQTAVIAAISPNYGAVTVGSLSGNATGYVNLYDGSLYVSGGVAVANPSSISYKPGISGTIGYIFGASDAKSTSDFLTGDANQAFISVPTPFGRNVVAAVTHAYGGATAIEIGVGQFGPITYGVVPWGHTTQVTGQMK